MGTKRTYVVLLLLIVGVACLQFQCNKSLDCANNRYGFEIGIKAYPDKDSVKVGDTLWLEMNEPTTLKDGGTGNMVDYSGAANLGSVISFHRLSPANEFTEPSAGKFKMLLIEGRQVESIDSTWERQYLFAELDQFYVFKIGIISKDTGIFRLIFSNAANIYRNSDRCTKAAFSINFKNTDQHYHLNPFYTGDTSIVGGDYYFRVYE